MILNIIDSIIWVFDINSYFNKGLDREIDRFFKSWRR